MGNEIAVTGPQELLAMAVSKDLDIDKLQKLMDMNVAWEAKESRKAFFKAMAKFQGLCPIIKKKKQGHNSKFAPMGDIQTQVKSLITKCGLSYRFEQSWDANVLTLSCIVSHLDGHSETKAPRRHQSFALVLGQGNPTEGGQPVGGGLLFRADVRCFGKSWSPTMAKPVVIVQ